MRTYYTTAASTWGTQSYESYTGSDSTNNTSSESSSSYDTNWADSLNVGETSASSFAVTSNSSANYSLTSAQSSYSSTQSYCKTSSYTISSVVYGVLFSITTATGFSSRVYVQTSSTLNASSCLALTSRNLTGLTLSSTTSYSYTSQFTDLDQITNTYINTDGDYINNNTTTSTNDTYSTSYTSSSSQSYDVATVNVYPVGSYQITLNGFTSSQTSTITNLFSTQTYGSTSTGVDSIYTSTSLVGYTDNTSTTTSFSTYTSSMVSQTITVTMNPKVELMRAYERGTAERLFVVTSAFSNTTKLLSEALSEYGTYTESASTVMTNTASGVSAGLTSSSTSGSSSFVSIYPSFIQSVADITIDPPVYTTYWGGVGGGTTTVSWGVGPFDITYSNAGGATQTFIRTIYGASSISTYNQSVFRINPLSYLSFSDTTTDYQNVVLTYNTTSLANP